MSLLEKAVDALGVADAAKDIGQAAKNLIEADNALDVGAAAGELAASLAAAGAIHGLLRPAFSGMRLGLAITGQIGKWEALLKPRVS